MADRWKYTIILIAIFLAGCLGSDKEDTSSTSKILTEAEEEELGNQTFTYIREVFLKPQGLDGEFLSIEPPFGEDVEELYVVNFTFGGRGMLQTETQAYVTSSGKLIFIQQIIDTTELPPHTETPAPTEVPEQTRAVVSIDDDYCLGQEDAPVTIIEFSNYQCSWCQHFWSQTLPQIKSEYIEAGKVKFVYRDFAGGNANAQKAAEATECAGDQEKFWEMHDKVFEGQGEWSGGDVVNITKRYASELGLDEDEFADCLGTGKYAEEVQKDLQDGARAGVSGTPAFFVNGIFVTGSKPFEVFKQIIDSELANNGSASTISGTCKGK